MAAHSDDLFAGTQRISGAHPPTQALQLHRRRIYHQVFRCIYGVARLTEEFDRFALFHFHLVDMAALFLGRYYVAAPNSSSPARGLLESKCVESVSTCVRHGKSNQLTRDNSFFSLYNIESSFVCF
jgi:hypothetical protein